jgi:hypothetical protein
MSKIERVETRPDLAKVARLADRIIGSPMVGSTLVDSLDELSAAEGRALDALAFECVGCNWWFAAHERNEIHDEWYCAQCAKEERS